MRDVAPQTAMRSRDDGATAVLVAICLLVLFGAGALAVDLGSAFETKREQVVDTDAAALAAAEVLGGDCANAPSARDAAREMFRANRADGASIPDTDILVAIGPDLVNGDCSQVEVSFTGSAQTTLAAARGVSNLDVLTSSTARADSDLTVGPLRPLVICDGHPNVVAAESAAPALNQVIKIDRTWNNGENCGGPGNWGYLCFAGNCSNGGSTGDIPDLITNGYPGSVTLGDAPPVTDDQGCLDNTEALEGSQGDGDHVPPWCSTKTGALGGSNDTEWTNLAGPSCTAQDDPDCPVFPILIAATSTGNGSNLVFQPSGYLYVRYYGWCTGGDSGGLPPTHCPDSNLRLRVDLLGVGREGAPDGAEIGGDLTTFLCGHDGGSVCPEP